MWGFNCKVTVWRFTNLGQDDTSVGGASITGTVQYQNVLALIQEDKPEPLLVQQEGLSTLRTLTATIVPGTLDVRERDEIQVTEPADHFYYGDYFRVIRVRNSSANPRDPKGYMVLNLTRSLEAHNAQ
jgi:hypothetical protein